MVIKIRNHVISGIRSWIFILMLLTAVALAPAVSGAELSPETAENADAIDLLFYRGLLSRILPEKMDEVPFFADTGIGAVLPDPCTCSAIEDSGLQIYMGDIFENSETLFIATVYAQNEEEFRFMDVYACILIGYGYQEEQLSHEECILSKDEITVAVSVLDSGRYKIRAGTDGNASQPVSEEPEAPEEPVETSESEQPEATEEPTETAEPEEPEAEADPSAVRVDIGGKTVTVGADLKELFDAYEAKIDKYVESMEGVQSGSSAYQRNMDKLNRTSEEFRDTVSRFRELTEDEQAYVDYISGIIALKILSIMGR